MTDNCVCSIVGYFQDHSENTHDGDLYDDVITSRGDSAEEVCCQMIDCILCYYV